jgi:hypothetical protein
MLQFPEDCWITFIDLSRNEYFCSCHRQLVIQTQAVDKIEERKDGWYWIGEGP